MDSKMEALGGLSHLNVHDAYLLTYNFTSRVPGRSGFFLVGVAFLMACAIANHTGIVFLVSQLFKCIYIINITRRTSYKTELW
jgi:hypothetical protein